MHKIENVQLRFPEPGAISKIEQEKLRTKMYHRWWMIAGEGLVFFTLLSWAAYRTWHSFKKEAEYASLQKNFLLSITHEFKSPLASIKLYLQTLQKHSLDPDKQQQFIQKAIMDAERLDGLVENTLLANIVDQKEFVFNKEEIDLSAFFSNLLKKNFLNRGRTINLEIESNLSINGDQLALSIMLNNLLDNALKYSSKELPVKVSLSKKDKCIQLQVVDQGSGIADDEKRKVFQKFYRIGNELTRTSKGTGLGLFLVKNIIENHDGTIKILDNFPSGTIVRVDFAC